MGPVKSPPSAACAGRPSRFAGGRRTRTKVRRKSLKSLPLSHRLICRPRDANSWQSSASFPTREPHTERSMKANTTPALSRSTEAADPVSVSQALPSHRHPPPNPSFKRTRELVPV